MKILKNILLFIFLLLGLFGQLEAKVVLTENEKIESFSEQGFQERTQETKWQGLLYLYEKSLNQDQHLFLDFSTKSFNQNYSERVCLKSTRSSLKSDFQFPKKSKSHQRKQSEIKSFFIGNPDLVDAWKAVGKHAEMRKHIPSIEKVSDLLNDTDFMSKLPNGRTDLDNIIDAVKNPLNGGGNYKLVKLADHLENVKQVVKKHSGADGFDRLMTDLKNPAFAMQDGATHMLNDVKNFGSGKIKKFDYEFVGDGVACTKCRFDVELTSGSPRLIEYKSWSLENIPNISAKQLEEYFRSATSIEDIKYVFNKLKTPSVGDVKSQFQVIIGGNAKTLFESNSNLFKDIKMLDGSTLNIVSWQQLEGLAKNNPDFYKSSLFEFIEVK